MTRALTADDLACGYGATPVLDGLHLVIPAGSIIGLSGPSGVGKTTVARTLAGLLPPLAGRVLLDGEQLRRGGLDGRVAMLFQSPRRSCDPRASLDQIIGEPLHVGTAAVRARRAATLPTDAIRAVATEVGLTADLLQRLPAQVSDGQLQRACLARALIHQPDYLICDEATAMLDTITTAVLAGLIRDRTRDGLGVLAISHDTELLHAWADDTYTLSAGSSPAPGAGRGCATHSR